MDELRRYHVEMFAALDDLERLTQAATCDDKGVMAARYRLTRASSGRRRHIAALCERLLAAGVSDPALAALRDATTASRAASSSHIGTWTLRQVVADWPSYVRASALMRASLRREIAREVSVLAPHFPASG